ncbi:hypothetical protein PMAA_072900 [Talaromyces marneffei ATCC 18224]|uniref:t-SNARE coiled-coil homology domain-containing protein n=3 Tax=Talaromyces marneffei TaxID=37727 RepID=B6QA49_TALMQ|nr:hypothetical protein PMAA_072900 [Talaromyces marneffei ATCC 18224]
MAKSITDIFRVKADRGGLYKNHNAWIIDIFCYDELERPTPFALAVILLERIKDHFCSNLDTNEEFLKPFKVAHQPKGNVESGFQQAVEILRPLVERVFERFPEASLNFMISGITTNDPSKGRLATLVLLLGRLMESVRMTKPQSRIKCIFCGNDFMKTEGFTDKRSDETVDINSLLGNFSRMALKQGNSIEGQNQTLTSIMGRMLVLRWSANDLKWERLKLKGEVSSKAIVLVSNALTVC